MEQVERRRKSRDTTSTAIQLVLGDSKEPMAVREIREAVRQLTGRFHDEAWFRKVLYGLIDAGLVVRRVETDAERKLRAGGREPRGYNAMLYSLGSTVPAREDASVVDGIPPVDTGVYGKRPKTYKKKARPAITQKPVTVSVPGLAKKPDPLTDAILNLVRVISEESRSDLIARVERLEDKIDAISKALSY
jgi:hypothetical protein